MRCTLFVHKDNLYWHWSQDQRVFENLISGFKTEG